MKFQSGIQVVKGFQIFDVGTFSRIFWRRKGVTSANNSKQTKITYEFAVVDINLK